MAYILVKHNVAEYSNWRKIYDEHKPFRVKSGMINEMVFRNTNNPNEIFMLFKWNNILNAKIFAQSEDLKKAMEKAGVMSKPEIQFLEETEQLRTTPMPQSLTY